MTSALKNAFDAEMNLARMAYDEGDMARAFRLLERAHILGQRYFRRHVISHWWMLKVGVRCGNRKEIRGQTLRLIACVPGFLFGWVPKGNTGGANVSPVRPMPIPSDLASLLANHDVAREIMFRMTTWFVAGVLVWAGYLRFYAARVAIG